MARIVLISCVSQKLAHPAVPARLYVSAWFRHALRYAQSLKPDKIFVLSAKYGLVAEDDIIQPYDETLNRKGRQEIRVWGRMVLEQLRMKVDLDADEFVFLAGERYRSPLLASIRKHSIPLEGMRIGKQLQFLKNAID